ncbi:MAG: hypothetical protein LBQ68_00975 [Clostridiales bacterium]|nr:hypothetical protein [Clostridiales bacterium]
METLIPASVGTAIIIQILKKFRLSIPTKYLPYLSIGIASLINAFIMFAQNEFDFARFDFFDYLLTGIVSGLTASGGYDTALYLLDIKKNQME